MHGLTALCHSVEISSVNVISRQQPFFSVAVSCKLSTLTRGTNRGRTIPRDINDIRTYVAPNDKNRAKNIQIAGNSLASVER